MNVSGAYDEGIGPEGSTWMNCTSEQAVGSPVHSVASLGHIVRFCGHTVNWLQIVGCSLGEQAVGSCGHFVTTFGHSVGTRGQYVGVPVPSGHSVIASSALQCVIMFEHVVSSYGHVVSNPAHIVGSPHTVG